MDNKILQSVIRITEQRDVDSLEYGLVATLAELLPLKAASLYKPTNQVPGNGIEKVIGVAVDVDESGEERYIWDNEICIVSSNKYLDQCLSEKEEVIYKNKRDNLYYFISPVICDKNIISVIEISSSEDIGNFKGLISGFTRIYENYLYILNKSEQDKLTGLFNRHSFDVKLDRLLQIQRNRQKKGIRKGALHESRRLLPDSSAWLVIIDIDHFKRINDTYGHVCGDEVLLTLSQIMKKFFRNSDLLFRFGGEEFVIILEPIPQDMAERTLERFRATVAEYKFPLVDKLTVSGGYIKITEKDYPPTIIEQADQALYYAKENGRNQISNFESLVESGKLSKPYTGGEVDLF